jgi:hypothetical protein
VWTAGVRFTAEERDFFLFSITPRPALGPTQLPIQCILGALSRGKAAGREADHSRPSGAEVKNSGAIPLLPPYVFMA